MMKSSRKSNNIVDDYIKTFPVEVQNTLQILRKLVKDTAPDAEETISYQMPAYKQNGILVYFAAYKNHIGFYPGVSTIKIFSKEISKYKNSEGTIQFPIDEPLPLELIRAIVQFRVLENTEKAAAKSKTNKK